MHEMPVVQSIMNIVQDEVKDRDVKVVKSIKICVGELTGLVPDSIQYYFDIVSKDTILENVKLDIKRLGLQLRCNECEEEFRGTRTSFVCPKCNSDNITLQGGNECYVDSIEVD